MILKVLYAMTLTSVPIQLTIAWPRQIAPIHMEGTSFYSTLLQLELSTNPMKIIFA